MAITDKEQLKAIISGNSFVRALPQNLGELVYFDTDNDKAHAPKTKKQYLITRILTIIVMMAIYAIMAMIIALNERLFDDNFWPWFIVIIIAIFVFAWGIGTFMAQTFEGTDYVIGKSGFATLKFKDNRENIKQYNELLFDNIETIYYSETKIFENDVYKGTRYKLDITVTDSNKWNELCCLTGKYMKAEDDIQYQFVQHVKSIIDNTIIHRTIEILVSNGFVGFPVKQQGLTGFNLFTILLFSNGDLKIDSKLIKKDHVNEIELSNGTIFVDYFDDIKKKMRSTYLKYSEVGNAAIFMHLCKNIYS